MPSHNKGQIQQLLDSNPAYVDESIRLLGANQTADELRSKGTHYHNDIGFSAAHARTGTRLYEFVTGIATRTGKPTWAPKSLAHPVANRVFSRYINNHGLNSGLELGRKIALVHWRQLEVLLSYTPVTTGAPKPKAAKRQPPASVVVRGAEVQTMKGKAVRVLWDSRRIWLPKSQIKVCSTTGDITMPMWLARNKQMTGSPSSAKPSNPRASVEALYDGRDAPRPLPGLVPMGAEEDHFDGEVPSGPAPGTWAATARLMAQGDDSGFDWDAWKDEMKEA